MEAGNVPKTDRSKKEWKLFLPLLLLMLLTAVFLLICSWGGFQDKKYVRCARTAVAGDLSSSVQITYQDERVLDRDAYGRVLVELTATVHNPYGNVYTCQYIVVIKNYNNREDTFIYNAVDGVQRITDPEERADCLKAAKAASRWGQPLQDSEIAG